MSNAADDCVHVSSIGMTAVISTRSRVALTFSARSLKARRLSSKLDCSIRRSIIILHQEDIMWKAYLAHASEDKSFVELVAHKISILGY